ncbi:MAG TPA: hypothetical protein PLD47_12005 [Aggregatilineales bacterium]|nr:hypothetical protein [Anaerolineales bacterium]HRE48439.1 hypothetical protein [Aggregatilineales bacterium]
MPAEIILLLLGTVLTALGWGAKTPYERFTTRPRILARLFFRRGTQDGISRIPLIIFDVINYGEKPVVIVELQVLIAKTFLFAEA